MNHSYIRFLTISISFIVYLQSATASGFRLPEYSAAGVATSNALVADTSRISAVAYNPAIMSIYVPRKENKNLFSGNVINVQFDSEVTIGATTTQGSGETSFIIPSLFVSTPITKQLTLGLLIHSPFGLETAWPADTFAPFASINALEPNLSRIKMYNANFNLGYQLNANTGFAFGLNRYELLDLQFNSQAAEIKGTGEGYGWNVAYIGKFDKLSLGISYRSAVHASADGSATTTTPATAIELDVTFPEMLTIGINYAVSDKLKVEFDIEHTGWDVYDNLNIRRSTDQSTLTLSTNNWKNTLAYRASVQYKINKHQILFGYAYDETPQGDAFYSARIPDADRQLFSIGYQYDFGNYQLETGLMLVKFDDRTVNSSDAYVLTQEPNGTTAYNGTYRSSATVISVGFNTTF